MIFTGHNEMGAPQWEHHFSLTIDISEHGLCLRQWDKNTPIFDNAIVYRLQCPLLILIMKPYVKCTLTCNFTFFSFTIIIKFYDTSSCNNPEWSVPMALLFSFVLNNNNNIIYSKSFALNK